MQPHGHGHVDDRQRVRDASDIVSVVGERVALRPKGREFVGLCPFHDDRRPSMHVVPSKQIFHCFVCGSGGDVFTFVQKFHSMEFREALEHLAERAGVELRPRRADHGSGAAPGEPTRADLVQANEHAARFFEHLLHRTPGPEQEDHAREARALIQRRGISEEMVLAFRLGVSADMWDGLLRAIRRRGLAERPFVDLGLLKARDSGGLYDAMRRRLIFPIQDQIGRVIAFGARRISEEDEPKYLNSPDTRLFDKSSTLYGLHQASRAIQSERAAVVVEGYTDVIACHQAGVRNVVATLGTALTTGHASILRRLCDTVVLVFDGDDAGQRAADRAIEVFFAEPIDLKIAALDRHTDAKDPDELLKRDGGPEAFRAAIDGAEDLLAFRFRRLREGLEGAGVAARDRVVREELDRLVGLGLPSLPPLRRRLVVQQIAAVAGVDEATIRQAMPTGRPARADAPAHAEADDREPYRPGRLGARESLLGCLLNEPRLWIDLDPEQRELVRPPAYGSPMLRAVAEAVARVARDGGEPGLQPVMDAVREADERAAEAAVMLASRVGGLTDGNAERLGAFWRDCLRRVELEDEVSGAGPAGGDRSDGDGSAALAARLERQRELHARYGANPRPRLARE